MPGRVYEPEDDDFSHERLIKEREAEIIEWYKELAESLARFAEETEDKYLRKLALALMEATIKASVDDMTAIIYYLVLFIEELPRRSPYKIQFLRLLRKAPPPIVRDPYPVL